MLFLLQEVPSDLTGDSKREPRSLRKSTTLSLKFDFVFLSVICLKDIHTKTKRHIKDLISFKIISSSNKFGCRHLSGKYIWLLDVIMRSCFKIKAYLKVCFVKEIL